MRIWSLVMVIVVVAACDRSRPVSKVPEKPLTPTILGEVEDILTGDTGPEEPDPEPSKDPETPQAVVPVAKSVPDKPGFVISPYNGKWIDVTGVEAGTVMADPHFPAEDKKYFKVPEVAKPATESEELVPGPAPDETGTLI